MTEEFTGLPDLPAIRELREHRQWVAWSYRMVDGRPTKPPTNPHTGFGASHSKPSTWGSYEEALARAIRDRLPGIGFVISADDDYTGADLDKCRDPETGTLAPWAADIVALAETYTEISPSGTGLRLIWRGKVAETIKADPVHVEVYRDRRYLTLTGNHLAGTPDAINAAPRTAEALAARVSAYRKERDVARGDAPAAAAPTTATVRHLPTGRGGDFFRRVNSAALASLAAWVPSLFGSAARHQPGTGAWRVSSRALARDLEEDLSISPQGIVDFGVHDMGDARDGKRSPVDLAMEFGGHPTAKEGAFWLIRQIGKDPEDFGWQEPGMGGDAAHGTAVAAALVSTSRQIREDPSGELIDEETGEVIETPTADSFSPKLPEELTHVPGLLGQLVDWLTDTADRPSRTLNLGVAVTALGALFGRRFASPTNLRTNVYLVTLASSGFGKTHPMARMSDLLFKAGLDTMLGGDRIKSDTGLRKRIEHCGSVLYMLDEVDGHIRPWLSRQAKAHQANIRDMILAFFSNAAGIYRGDDYGEGATDPIINPNLCLYGTTTHARFWKAFEGGSIDDGFLPRFILLDAGWMRPLARDPVAPLEPPGWLIAAMQAASGQSGRANLRGRVAAGHGVPSVREVPWGPGAKEAWASVRAELDKAQDKAKPEDQPIIARIGEHGQKLATILAIGRDWKAPYVSVEDLDWGLKVARASAAMMLASAGDMIADSQEQADYLKVRRMIREAGARGITARDLGRRIKGSIERRRFYGILEFLVEAGEVERVAFKTSGRPREAFLATGEGAK